MTRKTSGTLALWLAGLCATAALVWAAPTLPRHSHAGLRQMRALGGRPNDPASSPTMRSAVAGYLPPHVAVGVLGTLKPGDPSGPVRRGDKIAVYVSPGRAVAEGDTVTLRVSYLYQLPYETTWVQKDLGRQEFTQGHSSPLAAGVLPTDRRWDKLILVTDGLVRHKVGPNTTESRQVSTQAVDLDADLPPTPLVGAHFMPPGG